MARGRKRKPRPSVPFNRKLVLNQWLLALFGVECFDQHIVSVTQRLNERRITRGDEPVVWKYFQYLALLFTEIYLDRYFRDPRSLLAALNGQVALLQRGPARGRADRTVRPGHRGLAAAQQDRLLDDDRQWQDPADARAYPAVPAPA